MTGVQTCALPISAVVQSLCNPAVCDLEDIIRQAQSPASLDFISQEDPKIALEREKLEKACELLTSCQDQIRALLQSDEDVIVIEDDEDGAQRHTSKRTKLELAPEY